MIFSIIIVFFNLFLFCDWLYYVYVIRMFGLIMEYIIRNEKGEYEVVRGILVNVFKCILVRFMCFYLFYDFV